MKKRKSIISITLIAVICLCCSLFVYAQSPAMHPIWWHSASWVVYNFVKDNDFTGKKVIPFSTSSSSGEVGDDKIKDMTETGDWQTGMDFRSSASESTVTDWVNNLNLK